MKIDVNTVMNHPLKSDESQRGDKSQNLGQSPTSADNKPGKSQDTVNMSDKAQQLQRMQTIISELPVVDTKKVEAMKLAISQGNYQLDSSKIADKLMALEFPENKDD